MPDGRMNERAAETGPDAPKNRISVQNLLYAAAPALLYTALSSAVYSLLISALPGRLSAVMLQGIAQAVCLAYFSWRAVSERKLPAAGRTGNMYRYPSSFCYVISVVMCSIACNYLIYVTGLKNTSQGYRRVSETFYGNNLWVEITALCVIGPITEELVYRGFVFQRMRKQTKDKAAVFLSALLFGAMHFNLVQGIYGFVLGLLLAYIVCQTGSILTTAAAHMAANLTSILWTETKLLEFLDQEGTGLYVAAAVCMLLTGIFMNYGNQMRQQQKIG